MTTDKQIASLEVKLTNFEGPLDLLLHLVKENKIEIKDIFVSQITEQFLGYMTQLNTIDVDKASEYMAMAATLLEIKSHALLPVMPDMDNDMSAERNLIRQLEEYKMFQEVVRDLKNKQNVDRFYRAPEKLDTIDVLVVQDGFNLNGFMDALNRFLLKMQIKAIEGNTSKSIEKQHYTVSRSVRRIVTALRAHTRVNFFSLFDNSTTKEEVIMTFIAVLEMLKMQKITVNQQNNFDDFEIVSCEGTVLDVEDIDYDSVG